MFKKMFFLCLLLSSLFNTRESLAKGPAYYSKTADIFEFVDNASGWNQKSQLSYRASLETKFKLTSEESELLKSYALLRKRLSKNPKIQMLQGQKADAFGEVQLGYDHFSQAFYSSHSIREALVKLSNHGVSVEDRKMLSSILKKLWPKLESFLKESIQFNVKLLNFNKQWKSSQRGRALKYVKDFILGKMAKRLDLKMLVVWSPLNTLPFVEIRGPYLILHYNPLTQTDNWDYSDISRNAVMAILRSQPIAQRENLSKVFKLKCNGREFEFQESLKITFGVMLPKYLKLRKKFNIYDRWSGRTFIDLYAKLLFPLMDDHVKKKGTFAGFFMEQSSFLCRQLHQLAVTP